LTTPSLLDALSNGRDARKTVLRLGAWFEHECLSQAKGRLLGRVGRVGRNLRRSTAFETVFLHRSEKEQRRDLAKSTNLMDYRDIAMGYTSMALISTQNLRPRSRANAILPHLGLIGSIALIGAILIGLF
jgi:hypothetical protein